MNRADALCLIVCKDNPESTWVTKVIPAGWGTEEPNSATSTDASQLPTGWSDEPVKAMMQEAIQREEQLRQKIANISVSAGTSPAFKIIPSYTIPSSNTIPTPVTSTNNSTSNSNFNDPLPSADNPMSNTWDSPVSGVHFLNTEKE